MGISLSVTLSGWRGPGHLRSYCWWGKQGGLAPDEAAVCSTLDLQGLFAACKPVGVRQEPVLLPC